MVQTMFHPRVTVVLLMLLIATSSIMIGVLGQPNCNGNCNARYKENDLVASCTDLCENRPELFDFDYPYLFGPLPMKPYPNLTDIPADEINAAFPVGGELYARVNSNRTQIQFYLNMTDNPEPYFPYFAMHLHQGNLIPEEIGGHILVHISGVGDLVGCAAITRKLFRAKNRIAPCSDQCTVGNHRKTNCVNPRRRLFPRRCSPQLCNLALGKAYFCKGGCQGDRRIKGNTTINPLTRREEPQAVTPSRACDLNKDGITSNPRQREWIQGLHSHEFSGNETDGEEYSKYSIGVPENFDLWCGNELPFLVDDVLRAGAASYVALHVNFNVTGTPALAYGDVFTALSTTEGGPQQCFLFGDVALPCADGYQDIIKPIGEALP